MAATEKSVTPRPLPPPPPRPPHNKKMVRRGGLKKKIEIKTRETKNQRSVACAKRRKTVFSKAADLCLLSGANIAVFVTSPAENSDVVYSFSGHSPASEIADCFLNCKPPPKIVNTRNKLGFWWEDPDLYRNCNDLSELNVIEERLEKTKKDLLACLEKKERQRLVTSDHQNPSFSSSSQVVSFDQINPSFSLDDNYGGSCFDQIPNSVSSLEEIWGESSTRIDQNPSSFTFEDIELFLSSSSSDEIMGTKEEEKNNAMSVTQETKTEPMMVNACDDDKSFWDNIFNDDDLNLSDI
ncbi:unnamed protein product [Cochlearia groenlandica]